MIERQTTIDPVRSVELTEERVEEYLEALAARGRNQETVKTYRRCLEELRVFLSREKLPFTTENVTRWYDQLKKSRLSVSSVNVRMSAAKGLMEHCRLLPTAPPHGAAGTGTPQPMPTRNEYLRLLSYIRARGTKQEYYLIKIFGQLGIDVSELPGLTVDACRSGAMTGANGQKTVIPTGLCEELVSYAQERCIYSGPVMVTRNGRPIHRSNVCHMLNNAAEKAGLPPEKFSPSALGRMCHKAQDDIHKKLEPLFIQSYEQLLDTEQIMIAWPQEA